MNKNIIEHLLQPGKIGSMTLKNRLIYSAMTFKLSDGKGRLTEPELESMLYRAKQEVGPGLVIFPGFNASLTNPLVRAVNINTDENMFNLAKQVARFKEYDVKTMSEIGVLGLREGQASIGASSRRYPVAFEAITYDEMKRAIKMHVDMARRSKEAGFDSLKIATVLNKKILGSFISPFNNMRTDQYGGSTENRARFLIEVIEAMREAIGDDYPIVLDLKVDELMGDKGIQLEEGLELAKIFSKYVDAITPCVGCELTKDEIRGGYFTDRAYCLPQIRAVKEVLPNTAVIANGKLNVPSIADDVIATGAADFVALGRAFFVDPEWATKASKGETDKILNCVACLNCYTESLPMRSEIHPVQRACTVNPCNMREEAFYHLQPAEAPKTILVVGGGLAGMEAAATLAKRGHHVTLAEKSDRLGGQWIIASSSSEKGEYRTLIPSKQRLLEESGATVLLNTTVDHAYLEANRPDIVVLATGAVPKSLPLGKDLKRVNVVQGNDVIMHRADIGDRVAVIGGRFIGLEVAAQLAAEGKKVAVIDMAEIAAGANPYLIKYYNLKLTEYGVPLYPNSPVLDFTDEGVDILHLNFPVTVPADTIVLAVGTQPVRDLVSDLDELGIRYVPIGDCKRIGDGLFAIRDGAEAGRIL